MDRFDPETGLVFRETVVKARSRLEREPDWQHKCTARRPKYEPPSTGVESLYAKALRKLILKANTLSSETLQAVPATIVEQLWKAIRRENRESLHIWKIFVNSGLGDRSYVHSIHLSQSSLYEPLVNYFLEATSTSFAWMTNVLLSDVSCSIADLKQLRTVVNIRKLQIRYSEDRNGIDFDDKMLEYWALCARDREAFLFLELIVALNARGISSNSFKSLSHFPALESFILYNTSVKRRHEKFANQCGWSTQLDGGFSSWLKVRQLRRTYTHSMFGINEDFNELVKNYAARHRSEHAESDNLPVLSVEFSGYGRKRGCPLARQGSDLNDVLCFERKMALSESAIQDGFTAATGIVEKAQVSKKRKLRDGKSLQLDQLLGDF